MFEKKKRKHSVGRKILGTGEAEVEENVTMLFPKPGNWGQFPILQILPEAIRKERTLKMVRLTFIFHQAEILEIPKVCSFSVPPSCYKD